MSIGIGRQLSHQVLEQHRFRAIELHRKGWQIGYIAESFGVNRRAVSRWLHNHRRGGLEALKSKKAPGPTSKLTNRDIKKLLTFLKNTPAKFGFDTQLWTCKILKKLIRKKIGKSLHISNVWRLLVKLGLSNQKPERQALEQNPEEVRKWLEEEWPKIKAHTRRWQAMLYFQDEAGVHLTATLGKTWAPKGETPVVKTTGNRGTWCVSSAISPAGRLLFRIEKDTVTAMIFIDFLQKIIKHHAPRKVIIITDRAPPHIAKVVKQFLEQHRKHFALYYLPPYAPKLNPDEHVWDYLKNHKLNTHQAQTKAELKPLIQSKMRSIQQRPTLIQSFFYLYNEL